MLIKYVLNNQSQRAENMLYREVIVSITTKYSALPLLQQQQQQNNMEITQSYFASATMFYDVAFTKCHVVKANTNS